MSPIRFWIPLWVMLLCLTPELPAQLADVAGSKDSPLLQRYEGSSIIGYEFQEFGTVEVLLGQVKGGGPGKRNVLSPTDSRQVEGRATRLLYVAPEGRSPLEVLRNYEQELKKSGFTTVYQCAAKTCGTDRDGWLGEYYLYPESKRLSQTPAKSGAQPAGQVSEFALSNARDQRYLAAKREDGQGEVWVSLFVASGNFPRHKETYGRPIVLLDVVETTSMESRMVTVDAAAMANDVSEKGRVALYGIYFDTDKTGIKPESEPTLVEIAKFLGENPKVTVYVVGHTDNVGGYEYNMGLSSRRAAAVVQALTTKHGVEAAKLVAAGTGPLAPVAPNDSEEGRAKNRRVELVKR
jgi:outer membrane protein OmpA-like peptidoglycan-associated protein